jgi:hypothetical protein
MQSANMLNGIMQNVKMHSIVMLKGIMLSIITPIVMAPNLGKGRAEDCSMVDAKKKNG